MFTDSSTSLEGRRVLLVGGAGFIGHHLALALSERHAEVAVLDGLQVNNLLSLQDTNAPPERSTYLSMLNERLRLLRAANVPIYVDDARDYHRMNVRFAEFDPNVVVFLAAVSHASRANKDPRNTLDHSFRTLENALDSSRSSRPHFVFLSSSMVYGDFGGEAVTESSSCDPIGIYGAVKLGGEKLVTAYSQVFDIPYTIVRPSALYGERCISRRVAQIFIENALRNQPLLIQGTGEDLLDFTYIQDLVDGLLLAIGNSKSRNEIFNLTRGKGESILSLAECVLDAFPSTELRFVDRSALMPERGTLDIGKARDLLGYRPAFDLRHGIAKYIDWYRSENTNSASVTRSKLGPQRNE